MKRCNINYLIGLGTILVASLGCAIYFGVFNKPKNPEPSAARTAEQDGKGAESEPVFVLVANEDLYPGVAIVPAQVRVREIRATERALYEHDASQFFPGNAAVINMRVPIDAIWADQPLLRKQFEETPKETVRPRIAEGMRAVNVAVSKECAADGAIENGEYVDVWLTSRVSEWDGRQSLRTARLASDCRVIMKRIPLAVGAPAPVGDGQSPTFVLPANLFVGPLPGRRFTDRYSFTYITYTLEANLYRAALIAFAKDKGVVSLMPVPKPQPPQDQDLAELEQQFPDERRRIDLIRKGELEIDDSDLRRSFKIKSPKVTFELLDLQPLLK